VGVYPLSFVQFIMGGPPQWVFGSPWMGSTGVDEIFAGQMTYENQRSDCSQEHGVALAQIASSFRTPLHTFMEIVGTEGRLHLNRPFIGMTDQRQMIFYPPEGAGEEVPVAEKELYLGEVEDMHAAILDGEVNYLSLEETRGHIKTVLALHQSATTGRPVAIDSVEPAS